MSRRNIGAFTDSTQSYPGFISINLTDDNMVEIMVRSPAKADGVEGTQATIVVSRSTWADILNESIGALNES